MKTAARASGTRAALSRAMHKTKAFPLSHVALLLLAAASSLAGCGDRGMFSRGEFRGLSDAELGSVLDLERTTIGHRSTRCGDNAAMLCPKGMAPEVEVHLGPRSVIFDFSNVKEPGTFANVDFEGFVLELAAGSDTPILVAVIDWDATTLAVDREAVTYDERHLDMNFAGVAYDSDDFVKVDLLLGPLKLLAGGR